MTVDALNLRVSLRHSALDDGYVVDLMTGSRNQSVFPYFMLGEPSKDVLQHAYSMQAIPDVSLFCVNNAQVIAEGVIIKDEKVLLCNEMGFDGSYIDTYHPSFIEELKAKTTTIEVDDALMIMGPGHLVYGHWLVDFLPKIYSLLLCGHNLSEMKVLLTTDAPNFGKTWLELLGFSKHNFVYYDRLNDVVNVKRLIVPTCLRMSSQVSPLMKPAASWIANKICNSSSSSVGSSKKIWLARRNEGNSYKNHRLVLNAELFSEMATGYGYTILYPEDFSIQEQVMIFRQATNVAGEYGSALHSTIFSQDEIHVFALRSCDVPLGFLQSNLCCVKQQKIGYVFGKENLINNSNQIEFDSNSVKLAFELSEVVS